MHLTQRRRYSCQEKQSGWHFDEVTGSECVNDLPNDWQTFNTSYLDASDSAPPLFLSGEAERLALRRGDRERVRERLAERLADLQHNATFNATHVRTLCNITQ